MAQEKIRLSKLLSQRGICSRREADQHIEKGEVLVDGQIISTLGTRVSPNAKISLTPKAKKKQEKKVTILLNKPLGIVSTQPEKGYKAATAFLPSKYRHLNTVGRLDIDSTGLLILTEDGTLVKKIIGENTTIEKEYLVRVQGKITDEKIAKLNHGLALDGKPLKPAKVKPVKNQLLSFILREGKKRQIRRMAELVGLKVISLKRVRIGKILLGNLSKGKWRFLNPYEKF